MADVKFTNKVLQYVNSGLPPSTFNLSLATSSIRGQGVLLNQRRAISATESSLFCCRIYQPCGTICLRESPCEIHSDIHS